MLIKYEYKQCIATTSIIRNLEILNHFGKQGWILCCIDDIIFYFMRPIHNPLPKSEGEETITQGKGEYEYIRIPTPGTPNEVIELTNNLEQDGWIIIQELTLFEGTLINKSNDGIICAMRLKKETL